MRRSIFCLAFAFVFFVACQSTVVPTLSPLTKTIGTGVTPMGKITLTATPTDLPLPTDRPTVTLPPSLTTPTRAVAPTLTSTEPLPIATATRKATATINIATTEVIPPSPSPRVTVALTDDATATAQTKQPTKTTPVVLELTQTVTPPSTATIQPEPMATEGVEVTPVGQADEENYIRFRQMPQKPSLPSLLEWRVVGGEGVTIERWGGEWGEANARWDDLPSVGELEQTFPSSVGGWPIFYTLSADFLPDALQFSFTLPCEYAWLFSFPYPGGTCPEEGVRSRGIQQNFENGFMLWIEAQDVIIYSDWSGLNHGELPDTFEHEVDPIHDPSLQPPPGRLQPEYGLGKAWRETPGLRELLGWAVDYGTDFKVMRQSMPLHRYGYSEWISMANDGLITIDHPNPTWKINYSRPNFALPPGESGVAFFEVSPTIAQPGDIVTLRWKVQGEMPQFSVEHLLENATIPTSYLLETNSSEGVQDFRIPSSYRGYVAFSLSLATQPSAAPLVQRVALQCVNQWFFGEETRIENCPSGSAESSRAAMQNFTGGTMLWVQSQNRIFVFTNDLSQTWMIEDTFVHGVDLVNDPHLVPPNGNYQPEYGLGKVWREVAGVRDALGWAVDSTGEANYTAQTQNSAVLDGQYSEYLSLRDGRVLIISHPEGRWDVKGP